MNGGLDLDTAVNAHAAIVRAAAALERLSRLPDAVARSASASNTAWSG